jgi:hypothetical protein
MLVALWEILFFVSKDNPILAGILIVTLAVVLTITILASIILFMSILMWIYDVLGDKKKEKLT